MEPQLLGESGTSKDLHFPSALDLGRASKPESLNPTMMHSDIPPRCVFEASLKRSPCSSGWQSVAF